MVHYILMDIEGTTTSLAFVHDVLVPFAKSRVGSFLEDHHHNPALLSWTAQCQDTVQHEEGTRPSYKELPAVLHRWIEQDRKHPGLKAIQGMIWEEGYTTGAFTTDLYDEVVPCLQQWREQGIDLGIFSSGSEQAQRLLFGHTHQGDLTSMFSHFFDTSVGSKRGPSAYFAISQAIGHPPANMLFLSDVEAELDAARSAGFHTTQIARPGTTPSTRHSVCADFSSINLNREGTPPEALLPIQGKREGLASG